MGDGEMRATSSRKAAKPTEEATMGHRPKEVATLGKAPPSPLAERLRGSRVTALVHTARMTREAAPRNTERQGLRSRLVRNTDTKAREPADTNFLRESVGEH